MNENSSVFLGMKIEAEQKQALRQLAQKKDRPVSWLVRKAIDKYLEAERGRHEQPR